MQLNIFNAHTNFQVYICKIVDVASKKKNNFDCQIFTKYRLD
jgi:hypothetical protein